LLLTTHILVGVFLIGAAIVLLVRAVNVRHTTVVVLASSSLAAIIGAFGAGDFFARDGESSTSFWMALLTGVALLCCIYLQALTASADMAPAFEPGPDPEPTARAPYRRAAVPPQPAYAANPAAPGWPGPPAGRENTPPWRPDWRSFGYPEEQ
jgi:hypothetical protein